MAALARLRAGQNRTDEALAVLSEGVAICTKSAQQNIACVRLLQTRGRLYASKSKFDAAEADLNAAIGMQRNISGEDGARIASQFAYLSELQRLRGRYDEAIATAEQALDLFDKAGGGHWSEVAIARLQRAWANLELGKHQSALDEITEIETIFSKQSPDNLLIRVRMLSVKARALSRLDRLTEAKQTAAAALILADKVQNADATQIAGLKRLAATGQGY